MRSRVSRSKVKIGRTTIALFFSLLLAGCTSIQKPATEPFIALTAPPPKQEFRWTNGKLPKSFDPARAAAAPETDVASTIFEGLTELDPQTLEAKPALAEKWSSPDSRVWTFQLRKDARWSNGKRVVADDVVTSWRRLGALGDKAAHTQLIQNIVGIKGERPAATQQQTHTTPTPQPVNSQGLAGTVIPQEQVDEPIPPRVGPPRVGPPRDNAKQQAKEPAKQKEKPFGVVALDDRTVEVTLEVADKDFPRLIANPVFYPIYGDGAEFDTDGLDKDVVTSGAFTVASVGSDGVVVERSETYWDRANVNLERVRFVPKETAESALNAYKAGEVDAVTNAEFEPVALKLLSPYDDFRQTTHSAVNLYEVNTASVPFNDRRVREALAISIDREKLADGQLEGATAPAASLLPLGDKKLAPLTFDVQRARDLLDKAGYAGGVNFPIIRLVVNRNDTQLRIARTVARMWKQNLNLDTAVIVKEPNELDAVKANGEYDLMRRGVVLPTVDEMSGMTAILGSPLKQAAAAPDQRPLDPVKGGPSAIAELNAAAPVESAPVTQVITEADAVYDLNVIPLYFPLSYSLVKPYVHGFTVNGLGPASVKNVSIDNSWQPDRR